MTILANRCLDIIVDFGLLGTLLRCFMLRSEFSKGCTKAKTTSSMMYFPDQSFKNWSTSQNFSNPGSVNLWHHGGEQFWAIDRWVILFKCRFSPGKCWQHVCPSHGYHHMFPSGCTHSPFLSYPLLVSFRLDLACWRLALSVRKTQQIFWWKTLETFAWASSPSSSSVTRSRSATATSGLATNTLALLVFLIPSYHMSSCRLILK